MTKLNKKVANANVVKLDDLNVANGLEQYITDNCDFVLNSKFSTLAKLRV